MKQTPQPSGPRCPRCDQALIASSFGRGARRDLTLACPEPYCDYDWAPTEGELARMGPLAALGGSTELETRPRAFG